jgi:hypothetical protein
MVPWPRSFLKVPARRVLQAHLRPRSRVQREREGGGVRQSPANDALSVPVAADAHGREEVRIDSLGISKRILFRLLQGCSGICNYRCESRAGPRRTLSRFLRCSRHSVSLYVFITWEVPLTTFSLSLPLSVCWEAQALSRIPALPHSEHLRKTTANQCV